MPPGNSSAASGSRGTEPSRKCVALGPCTCHRNGASASAAALPATNTIRSIRHCGPRRLIGVSGSGGNLSVVDYRWAPYRALPAGCARGLFLAARLHQPAARLGAAIEPAEVEQLGVGQLRRRHVLQGAEDVLDAARALLLPLV